MTGETSRVRLLPWTGTHGQPCILLTDGDGGAVSRLADRIEDAQLDLADRLLGRTRDVFSERGPDAGEFAVLVAQLADALQDALLIAHSRGARLDGERKSAGNRTDSALSPTVRLHDALAHSPSDPRGFGLLTPPGHDLTSASAARRYLRDTARSWGLPSNTTDDLATIAGELVANALEHSDSRTITATCSLTADSALISVTDEGGSRTPVALPASAGPPAPEQERGRGLLITEALADRWGTRRASGGVTVWAEVALESPKRAG